MLMVSPLYCMCRHGLPGHSQLLLLPLLPPLMLLLLLLPPRPQVLLLTSGDVLERCMACVRQVKGVTATYRMTAKGPPVRHSHYVAGVSSSAILPCPLLTLLASMNPKTCGPSSLLERVPVPNPTDVQIICHALLLLPTLRSFFSFFDDMYLFVPQRACVTCHLLLLHRVQSLYCTALYCTGVLQPLRSLLEPPGPLSGLPPPLRASLARHVADAVCERYAALAEELLEGVRRTESSLRRLKKTRPGEGAAGSSATAPLAEAGPQGGPTAPAAPAMSDSDKIALQLSLDAAEHGAQLQRLGLGLLPQELPGYARLLAAVGGAPSQQQPQQQQQSDGLVG
jgi:Domain of unknown function (DUF3510)